MLHLVGCTPSTQAVYYTDQLVKEQFDTKRHVTVSSIHVHDIVQRKTDKLEKIHRLCNM